MSISETCNKYNCANINFTKCLRFHDKSSNVLAAFHAWEIERFTLFLLLQIYLKFYCHTATRCLRKVERNNAFHFQCQFTWKGFKWNNENAEFLIPLKLVSMQFCSHLMNHVEKPWAPSSSATNKRRASREDVKYLLLGTQAVEMLEKLFKIASRKSVACEETTISHDNREKENSAIMRVLSYRFQLICNSSIIYS